TLPLYGHPGPHGAQHRYRSGELHADRALRGTGTGFRELLDRALPAAPRVQQDRCGSPTPQRADWRRGLRRRTLELVQRRATGGSLPATGDHDVPGARERDPAVIQSLIAEAFTFFLLAFPALFSIINPLGGSFIFLAATSHLPLRVRNKMARKIAFYSFVTLIVSMLIGAYVLKVFGISMPVLRVAGGIVIALSAWKMLTADDEGEKQKAALEDASGREAENMAFYPLTMPVTSGPGTISVAIALGTRAASRAVLFAIEAFATAALICLLIYWFYAGSSRLAKAVGPTGTSIIARLSAFLLFCIGIQVLWSGLAELVATLPHVP